MVKMAWLRVSRV